MKCDKLKSLWVYCRDINEDEDEDFIEFAKKNGYEELVAKSEVDAAIAELKQTIDELVSAKKSAEQILQNLLDCGLIKEWYFNGKFNAVLKADDPHLQIAELKAKLEDVQASMYCDVVDANMEIRRLRRALWLARAERAKAMYTYWHVECIEGHLLYEHKWIVVERLCRAKAEEYK